jgi:hypothetical protein
MNHAKISEASDFFIERLSGRVLILHTKDADATFVIPSGISDEKWLTQVSASLKREAAQLFERAQQVMARAQHAELAAGLCITPAVVVAEKSSSPSQSM